VLWKLNKMGPLRIVLQVGLGKGESDVRRGGKKRKNKVSLLPGNERKGGGKKASEGLLDSARR